MIVDAIVAVVLTLLTGIFGLLPAFSLGGSLTATGSELGASLSGLSGVIPVGTIGLCLAALIGARLFLLVWDLLVWIYDRFPFKAT